ncbi:Glycosylphosphatidylinositol anchor biosynthesis protein 11 [Tolypocladium capitatum]|uniref:Glycosylphosphatidylinositol anchor biosynthesis protein 11 n=1 Tax=Tolypocladium capitatum TaxID=45235 RepID=A0A2K3QD02_9HYPO|nr:Glycosylphosphatidylinositol anchor biosynthesis protein 11 [Tolypocladium capitatum]
MPPVDPVTMSSTLAKGSSTQGAEPKAKAAIHPVPVFDTPLAKGIAFARPAALLGLLALRFNALVAEPVSTLQSALPVVVAIQAVYAVLCLPVAGSQHAKATKKARPGEKKKSDATGPNPISTAILSLVLAAIATPAVHVLFILFGAPFLDHAAHTILCSAHFALLGLFPVFYARGVDSQALIAVAGGSAPLDETFGGLVGALVGAWLGAVPIPLDWDREWQRWPVTIVAGMYAGSLLCGWASGAVFYGKRWGGSGGPC